MLPVTVIGGYLGAGKTTLVNHLLRHAGGLKLAVLVNEFGALPIDEDLIEAQDDKIMSIAGGCICCSYGDDLAQAMIDLGQSDRRPDHILVEASGVAIPGAIAASISTMPGLQVDGVVILADAETIRDQADNEYIGDTIERQLADADMVLLNKCDLVERRYLDDLQPWLEAKASDATVVRVHHSKVPNAIVLQQHAWREAVAKAEFHPHADAFESRIIPFAKECDAEMVAKTLADPRFRLIRAKGFVPTPAGMRAVHVVGRRWAVSEAPAGAAAGVVVIAEKQGSRISSIGSFLEENAL